MLISVDCIVDMSGVFEIMADHCELFSSDKMNLLRKMVVIKHYSAAYVFLEQVSNKLNSRSYNEVEVFFRRLAIEKRC